MELTRNFALHEFIVSREHPDLAERIKPSTAQIERMRFGAAAFLQPIRDKFGRVVILSGIRSHALNSAIGGAKTSDHLYERDTGAVDFTIPGADLGEVVTWIRVNLPNYKMLIYYPKRRFIHLSFPDNSGVFGRYMEK